MCKDIQMRENKKMRWQHIKTCQRIFYNSAINFLTSKQQIDRFQFLE